MFIKFWIFPFGIYTFFQAIFPGMVRVLEGPDGNLVQRGRDGDLDHVNSVKPVMFASSLNPRKQKKSISGWSLDCKGTVQRCQVVLHQKFTYAQSGVAESIVLMKHSGNGDVLSHTKDHFSNFFENINLVNSIDCLSWSYRYLMTTSSTSKMTTSIVSTLLFCLRICLKCPSFVGGK